MRITNAFKHLRQNIQVNHELAPGVSPLCEDVEQDYQLLEQTEVRRKTEIELLNRDDPFSNDLFQSVRLMFI